MFPLETEVIKKRVLFVGEDNELWLQLSEQWHGPESEWEPAFALTASQALSWIGQSSFDALVVDVDVRGMEAEQLLNKVMDAHPQMLRFIRSKLAAQYATLRWAGSVHRHLMKPCDAQTVQAALSSAFKLKGWLPAEGIQTLITQVRRLPSPPRLYLRVASALKSPDASVQTIGALISEDPALSAKVLQLANSTVFGLQLHVSHPAEAVAFLGMELTRSLVLAAHTFSFFEHLTPFQFSIDELCRHSLATGLFAQWIAQAEKVDLETEGQAFAAGMLHDLGKLVLAANLPKPFGQALKLAREQAIPLWQAEITILKGSHAEVGAWLLGTWGLPIPIVEAVALHHQPARLSSSSFSPLTAVHVANVFEHEGRYQDPSGCSVDSAYLEELGLSDRVKEWRGICLDRLEARAA
jgi:HD-like signal output (HDOD) protein